MRNLRARAVAREIPASRPSFPIAAPISAEITSLPEQQGQRCEERSYSSGVSSASDRAINEARDPVPMSLPFRPYLADCRSGERATARRLLASWPHRWSKRANLSRSARAAGRGVRRVRQSRAPPGRGGGGRGDGGSQLQTSSRGEQRDRAFLLPARVCVRARARVRIKDGEKVREAVLSADIGGKITAYKYVLSESLGRAAERSSFGNSLRSFATVVMLRVHCAQSFRPTCPVAHVYIRVALYCRRKRQTDRHT